MGKHLITPKDVETIAHLARINLTEKEGETLTHDLENILHYVAKLEQLDVSRTDPTTHVAPLKNVFRKDEVRPSLSQSEALKVAVSQQNGSFKVPQVIE